MKSHFAYLMVFVLFSSLVLGSGSFLDALQLDLVKTDYIGGEFIEGDVFANASKILDPGQFIEVTLVDSEFRIGLIDLFDAEGITYEISDPVYEAINPASSKTLAFPGSSAAKFYVKLPNSANVQSVGMEVHGLPYNNFSSYPSFVKMDVASDGRLEWSYTGGFDSFGDYVLPSGLDENSPGGVALVSDAEFYYCEVIDVPESRDFEVYANYRMVGNEGNLFAMMFSPETTPSGYGGSGGADYCDLSNESQAFGYEGCTISIDKFVSGDRLFCVYNANFTSSPLNLDLYELQQDLDGGSGKVCGPLVSGHTDCIDSDKDFFIKVKAANYSGELIGEAGFDNWFTEYSFSSALNNEVGSCDGDCIIPILVRSESRGNIYLNNLEIRYQQGSSGSFVESTFYDASITGGELVSVEGTNVEDGVDFDFKLETLGVLAPITSQQAKNYTLEICVEGSSVCDEEILWITQFGDTGGPRDVVEVISTYEDILNRVLNNYGGLLDSLGLKDDVEQGLTDLVGFASDADDINQSTNMTSQEMETAYSDLVGDVDDAMVSLPKSVLIDKIVTDTIVVGIDDLTDDVVLSDQKNQESKNKLYVYQDSFTVIGTAQGYKIEFFSEGTDSGTYIEKSISGSGSGVYAVEVIPGFVAGNANVVQFAGTPEVVRSASPAVVRWFYSSPAGQKISYVIQGDQVANLFTLKTVMVPKILPSDSGRIVRSPVSYTCGDGVCSVFETADGEVIQLETSLTCPQDCKKGFSWMPFIIGLLLIAAIVYYLNFYNGKFSFKELIMRMKKKNVKSSKGKIGKQVFISQADQRNLMNYVQQSSKKGFNKSQVTKALLAKGWRSEQIEQVFKLLKK